MMQTHYRETKLTFDRMHNDISSLACLSDTQQKLQACTARFVTLKDQIFL